MERRMKIPISQIKIEREDADKKRFRRDLGDVQEMVESLKKYGLLHPVVVAELLGTESCEDENKYSDYKFYRLIAGERRITAAAYLGWKDIECTFLEDLSDVQKKEIELEENIQRKDVSWEEKIEALRQLDELKRKEHGEALGGHLSDPDGWNREKLAKAVGASAGKVSQDIKLANELNEHPELRKLVSGKTKQEARKTIEREVRAAELRERVAEGKIIVKATLIHGRAEDGMKELKSNSVHCVITDPPFGASGIVDVAKGNLSSDYDDGTNALEWDVMEEVHEKVIKEMARVLIPGGHFYLWHAPEHEPEIRRMLTSSGFLVDHMNLIWGKGRSSMIPNPYHYLPSYEMILFGCREPRSRTLTKPVMNLLRDYPAPAPQIRVHPLQKPEALIRLFIHNSTSPGETVMDCFAGSGIVLKTAVEMGRKAIGFEMDEKNYLMAMKFLSGE
jgi:ParB/RepB/Spo0J family partition protein